MLYLCLACIYSPAGLVASVLIRYLYYVVSPALFFSHLTFPFPVSSFFSIISIEYFSLSFRLERACGARNGEISKSEPLPCHFAPSFSLSFRPSIFFCHFNRAQRAEKFQSQVATDRGKIPKPSCNRASTFFAAKSCPCKGEVACRAHTRQAERVLIKIILLRYPNFEIFRLRTPCVLRSR